MKNSSRSLTPSAPALALALLALAGACTSSAPRQDESPGDDQELAATIDPRTEWLKSYSAEQQGNSSQGVPAAALPSHRTSPDTIGSSVANSADPGASSTQDADDPAARARLAASLSDQRLATLVDGFIDQGLAALDRGELEQAHKAFANAWELDPTNEVARDLYQRSGALTGDDAAGLGALAADARTLSAVRSQQRGVDIEHHLSLGRNALASDDPEQALQHFEDALTLIRFSLDAAPGTPSEADVLALVAQAQRRIDEQLAERDQELAERALAAQEEWDYADRNRTTLQIQALISAANDAFLSDEFDTAIDDLDQALKLDPNNEDATNLRRIAAKAGHEQAARDIRRAYRKQWNRTFDDLEHDTIVPNDLITFPSDESWAETLARGPKSFAPGLGGRPQDDQAVIDRLDSVAIPYAFDGNTLTEVLDHLREISGVNFITSADVSDLADNESITAADRHPQPISRILKIVLEGQTSEPMTYVVRDGIVHVLTQTESSGDNVLEMYDIRDLTSTPSDYPSEDFNLLPSGTDAESFTEGVEEDPPQPTTNADSLVSLITENIDQQGWEDDAERSISPIEGTLIVRAPAHVHEQIRQMLKDLRANTTTLINIETRFIEVEDSFLEDIGVDLRGLEPVNGSGLDDFGEPFAGSQGSISSNAGSGVGTPAKPVGIGSGSDSGAFYSGNKGDLKGRTENLFDSVLGESGVLTGGGGMSLEALFLGDTNVNAVLRAVTKYQTSNIVNAPSLTLRSGQRGNIKVLENRTYIRDFEPEIATGAVIAQPELAVVKSGVVLDVRAVASADRRFVTLELRPTIAELVPDRSGNLLPEFLVSLGTPNANNVTLHLPELKIQRLRTTSTVPDGGTLLLAGLKTSVEQDQESGLPFLSDIPVLSFFFTRKGNYTSRRKLLILLTATIIAPEEHEPTLH